MYINLMPKTASPLDSIVCNHGLFLQIFQFSLSGEMLILIKVTVHVGTDQNLEIEIFAEYK